MDDFFLELEVDPQPDHDDLEGLELEEDEPLELPLLPPHPLLELLPPEELPLPLEEPPLVPLELELPRPAPPPPLRLSMSLRLGLINGINMVAGRKSMA